MSELPFSEGALPGGKEPGALRTIGEVSAALGIRPHVLRYWEGQFPMLQPLKRSGGRRYYRPQDVALLQTINRLLNAEGYTVRGACAVLAGAGGGGEAAAVAAEAGGEQPDEGAGYALRIGGAPADAAPPSGQVLTPALTARLAAIRDRLRDALDAAA